MISLEEAISIVKSKSKGFGNEYIELIDAYGRVLDEDIHADRDYPPFNRSAMDGYAINSGDWNSGIRKYKIIETIFAGSNYSKKLNSGECYKIMTGAAVPESADCVIRREDAEEVDGFVTFSIDKIKNFQNIAQKGEDLKANAIAIRKNTICNSSVISTLATLGKTKICVKKLPDVAFFTTGNEVMPADSIVSPIQIRNSNEWLVKSLLKNWKIEPKIYKHLPDNRTELEHHIKSAIDADIIILSGGVSAGDADFIPEVLEKLGVTKIFHKVQIRPGKPFWFGQLPNGGHVFALPGNPFSTMVTFKLFVETYLEENFNYTPTLKLSLTFSGNRIRKSSFDEFFPVVFNGSPTQISPIKINGSGDIRLGLYADAIAHHPKENPELSPGILLNCYQIK